MQISLEWLKTYIKLECSLEELVRMLTFSGIEVENHYSYGDIPNGVVTAKVIESQPIEGSDHLQVCSVETGEQKLQIVCGAPNCRSGIIAALALPETNLKDIQIKKTKIRGVESHGMLCSEKELSLSEDHSGIIELPADTPIGKSLCEIWNLPDEIFELEITPNRPDLLGYMGIATDLAASSGSKLTFPEVNSANTETDANTKIDDHLSLEVKEPTSCIRYVARLIRNVRIGESPEWLKQRLIRSGLRPINNVVDITNYVMLETGHPLHAFDYNKLPKRNGKAEIIVRNAELNEQFCALDGNEYSLSPSNLVIADSEKAIALAGVIGGTNSHITDNTVDVVLEAACFDHTSIRKTSYQHKISTDSAYRFERQLAPETCEEASLRAASLIVTLAAGTLSQGKLDVWNNKAKPLIIPIRPSRFEQVIGISLTKEQIQNCLNRLGLIYLGEGCYKKYYPNSVDAIPRLVTNADGVLFFESQKNRNDDTVNIDKVEEGLYFEIPPKRVDLTREIDLIEEISRIHGLDKINSRQVVPNIMDQHAFLLKRKLADYFCLRGFNEVVNLSFGDPDHFSLLYGDNSDESRKQIQLLNPQNSNLSVMRTNLAAQLLQTASYNINRSTKQMRIFEMNRVFQENHSLPKIENCHLTLLAIGDNQNKHWKTSSLATDFYDLKGLVTDLLETTGLVDYRIVDYSNLYYTEEAQSILCEDKQIAAFGKLKPSVAINFGIDSLELKSDVWLADIDVESLIDLTRDKTKQYKQVPKFPSSERDISFLIADNISFNSIQSEIKDAVGNSLYGLALIDEFRGKQVPGGMRSLTFRIVFNHPEKTLTDDEVDLIVELVKNKLKSLWDVQLR